MPFKSEKQRKWMHANKPKMAKDWEKKKKTEVSFSKVSTEKLLRHYKQMADERLSGSAALTFRLIAKELNKRKVKLPESVNEAKVRAGDYIKIVTGIIGQINKVRGAVAYVDLPDNKGRGYWPTDIRHLKPSGKKEKGKTLWLESVNEDNIKFSKEEMAQLHKDGQIEKDGHTIEFGESVNEANVIQKIDKLAKRNKYGTVDGTRMNGKTAKEIMAIFKHPKMNSYRRQMMGMKSHELADLTVTLVKPLKIKVESTNEAKKPSYTKDGKLIITKARWLRLPDYAKLRKKGVEHVLSSDPKKKGRSKYIPVQIESINEKMNPEQYHRYMQYVFDTQFNTPEEKKMKKSIIKKINKAQKKKGLPLFKEERDYKAEYKKFQSSTKAKKYRAELNKYNRKKGTYGNGDGKDASHKGGKIVGFESQSKNRGRAEKSRLKKESKELLKERRNNWLGEAKATDLVKLYKSAEKDLTTYTNKINRIKRELSTSAFGSIQTKMTSLSKDVDKVKEAVIKGIADFKKAGKLESVNEDDLGYTTKKGKTIRAVHKTSGKEIVVVDNPASRKRLKRMGFIVK